MEGNPGKRGRASVEMSERRRVQFVDEPPAAVPKRKRSLEGDDTLGLGGRSFGGALVPANTDAEAATGEHPRAAKRQQTVHPVAARLAAATLSLTATFPPILAVHHPSLFTSAASACSAAAAAAVRAAPRRRRVQLVAGRRPTPRSASWLRRPPRAPPVAAAANGFSVFGASAITRPPLSLMDSAPEFEELDEQFVPAALQPPPEPVVFAPSPAPALGGLGGGLGGVASGGGVSGVPGASLLGLGVPAKPAEPAADKAPPSLLEAALGDLKGDTGKASRVRRVASTMTAPPSSSTPATATGSTPPVFSFGGGGGTTATGSTPPVFSFGGAAAPAAAPAAVAPTASAAPPAFAFGSATPATQAPAFGGGAAPVGAPAAAVGGGGFSLGSAGGAPSQARGGRRVVRRAKK